MKSCITIRSTLTALAIAATAVLPNVAVAQSTATTETDRWRFSAIIYAYLPSIDGSLSVPFNSSGPGISVDADTLLDSLNFAFMGTLDAHNGRWGMFTDVMYLDVGGDQSGTRDFTIGNRQIPGNLSADLSLDLKGVVWTIAGQYRLVKDPTWTVDGLFGARLFGIKPEIGYTFSGDLGTLPIPGRSGSASEKTDNWDAIVGVKGEYRFGGNREWSIPFYADVGTGESDLTWQVAAGIAYSFSWGDLMAMWRYVDYDLGSGGPIEDMTFNGPMFGVRFRW